MIRYFLGTLGSHFRAGRTLYLLTLFGVALGVASVLSIQVINRNAIAAFRGSVEAVSGGADFSVLGRTPTFPEEVYADVLSEPGVAAAWPLHRVEVALPDEEAFFLEVLGVDFFAPMQIPWRGAPGDLSNGLSRPGWVAISPRLAAERGLKVGDPLEVASGSGRIRLVVGALVDFQSMSPLASPKLVVMDIAQAQSLFGRRGEIHQIDVQVAEDVEKTRVMDRLRTALGPSLQVVTPEERERQALGLMAAFRLNLTALSLISLFVGVFLVYSSTQASLIRRRAEFGLLRSIGSTPLQVCALILGEVVILGALGVMLGIPLGFGVAEASVDKVSATLSNLYLLEEISSLQVPVELFALAGLVGIGGAVAGAVIPALDLSRRDTRSLLSAFVIHEKIGSAAKTLFVIGMCVILLPWIWYQVWSQTWQPSGFVLGIGLLIGIPLLSPFLVQQACGSVRIKRFGFGYSLKSLGLQLQTTSVAVASLAVAVSMLIGITLMIGSFRKTLEVWVATSIQADIYVTPRSWRGKGAESTLDPEIVRAMAAHPGVAAVDRLRAFLGYTGEQRISIAGVEMGLVGGAPRFPLLEGEPPEVFRQVREDGKVLVGETLARKRGLAVGEELPLYGREGELRLEIAGVYYDYSTEGGIAVMDLTTMARHFGPGPVNSVALYLAPGYDPERVLDELKARFPEAPLLMRSNRRLRAEISKVFEETFAVTRILQFMSLAIATCGVALTLLVLARERISELALYRALGAGRRQLFNIFVWKGLAMGFLGLTLGLLGGLALAGVLIFVINRAYFGWTIQVYWPWRDLLQEIASIVGAAGIASLYPALRASRTPARELSRDDI